MDGVKCNLVYPKPLSREATSNEALDRFGIQSTAIDS